MGKIWSSEISSRLEQIGNMYGLPNFTTGVAALLAVAAGFTEARTCKGMHFNSMLRQHNSSIDNCSRP